MIDQFTNVPRYIAVLHMLETRIRQIDRTRKVIEVKQEPGDENWEYVFIDAGNGKKQMAVF